MIELSPTPAGTILPIQGQPGARRDAITGVHAGRLKVAVTQIAEKGKATEAIRKLIAESLAIAVSRVTVIQGETQPKKLLLLQGLTPGQVQVWLNQLPTQKGKNAS